MSILTELLKRRGINSTEELSKEERVEFDQWKAVLSKEDITLKDVSEFCTIQLNNIEAQFKDHANYETDKIKRLALLHSVYGSLKSLIESPRAERENLEKYLTQLLNQ